MSIDFSPERWERIHKTYGQWWSGRLDRPILPVELVGRDPGRAKPEAPLLTQATCADLSIPADALVDRLDWELSRRVYLGDAYPWVSLTCFGPGVMAAFLGARLDNSTGQVWFHGPSGDGPITELHLEYDPDNPWLCRIKELYGAMMRRWQGQVLVSMTDLGGNMDILSTFRPSELLLYDLYDHPEEVERLLWEEHELWHRYLGELNDVLEAQSPGYTAWCGIYSDKPYYILQCDFCYMIGAPMFEQFVKPELEATVRRLGHSFYHLDGPGQLPHLDAVLSIEGLDGVQWVPGAGKPRCCHWPQIYERIFAAGKKAQVIGTLAEIDQLLQQTGLGAGVHARIPDEEISRESEVRGWLERFEVEV